MSDSEEASKARIAELEERCRTLELQVPAQGTRTSGRFVVRLIGALLVAAFGTALLLWTAAKRTATARAAAVASAPHPSQTRIDAAGRAVARGVDACVEDKAIALPSSIVVRVKLAPTGTLAILDAKVTPPDDALGPCVRMIPAGLRVVAGSEAAADIEVKVEISREPDGARVTKITWAERATSPAFEY